MRHLHTILTLLLLTLLTACIGGDDEPAGDSDSVLRTGDLVPDFSITLDDGSVWHSRATRNAPVLLVFFNTTCPDCEAELPKLQEVCDAVGTDRLIAISRAEGYDDVHAYWHDNKLSIPFAARPTRDIYNLFARSGIPRLYLIGTDGRVAALWSPDNLPGTTTLIEALS